jgi:adenosylcobinamide kinase/adenosylcobinamide-phosphate guanylyltransferase
LPALTFVLGGVRSGKSAHAEGLVLQSGLAPLYIATAEPLDSEMSARIRHHRELRGEAWDVVETPLALAEALAAYSRSDRAILVDCLTLWLTNVMLAQRDPAAAAEHLLTTLAGLPGPVVLVSNEIGLGVVPLGQLSRDFVDQAGRLHQRLAAMAGWVRLMVAGLPLDLKSPGRACTS